MAKEIENIQEKLNWHWRNSMRPVRFFALDARASIPFLVLLIYARPITLATTIVTTVIFYIFEKRGLTTPAALRAIRVWLIGANRPGLVSVKHKKLKDYG